MTKHEASFCYGENSTYEVNLIVLVPESGNLGDERISDGKIRDVPPRNSALLRPRYRLA